MSELKIRTAAPADLEAVRTIYAGHVLTGLASFEETPPDLAEIEARHAAITNRNLPYLVGERSGLILGFAYASPYRSRSAYRFTLEDSIYVEPRAAGQGVGSRLLAAVVAAAEERGYRRMLAVIGDSANAGSIALHARAGFLPAGVLPAVGFKHGRWVDSVLMQRPLGGGDRTPPLDMRSPEKGEPHR